MAQQKVNKGRMKEQSITAAYYSLFTAVINRAIDDLKQAGPRCGRKEPDRAMAFVLSDTCEAYCLELAMDYKTIREKAAALYRRILAKEKMPGKRVMRIHRDGYQIAQ